MTASDFAARLLANHHALSRGARTYAAAHLMYDQPANLKRWLVEQGVAEVVGATWADYRVLASGWRTELLAVGLDVTAIEGHLWPRAMQMYWRRCVELESEVAPS